MDEQKTDFGFQPVDKTEKVHKVTDVFDSIAHRYDLMNDLMSGGLHRWWKKFTLNAVAVGKNDRILDIAAGTGDLTLGWAKKLGQGGAVWLTDINASMLALGQKRLQDKNYLVPAVLADAEQLPFPDNYFNLVSVAFGLRNMTNKDAALAEMYRVLQPGGHLLVLEFSKVYKPLAPFYDLYSFKVLPRLGKLIVKEEDSYRYLVESIRMHPDQETLKNMMLQAGFGKVDYFNLTAGVVALHKAVKY